MVKLGRPKIDHPKDIRFSIRLDKTTADSLAEYCADLSITKGEAIRRGIQLINVKRRFCAMDAYEARKASEKGAISSIEELIHMATDKGITSIDLEGYDFWDAVNEDVENYFRDKNYRFIGSRISW